MFQSAVHIAVEAGFGITYMMLMVLLLLRKMVMLLTSRVHHVMVVEITLMRDVYPNTRTEVVALRLSTTCVVYRYYFPFRKY